MTISRLLLAFAFPFLPAEVWAGAVAYGLATEFLDGWLARRLGSTSRFGVLLDPVADKLFVGSVLGTLLVAGLTTWPELLLVGLRDLVIATVSLRLLWRRDLIRKMEARLAGKATTALQMGFLLWLVVFGDPPPALIYGTAAVGAYALVDYVRAWNRPEPEESAG